MLVVQQSTTYLFALTCCGCSSNRYNTFASAGSDGTVSIWDHQSKKRLRQYQKFNCPVPSIAFNCDGTKLAIGVSYTWDEGEEGAKTAERPKVVVRNVGDEAKVSIHLSVWNEIADSGAISPKVGLIARVLIGILPANLATSVDCMCIIPITR